MYSTLKTDNFQQLKFCLAKNNKVIIHFMQPHHSFDSEMIGIIIMDKLFCYNTFHGNYFL